jgi:hypothetical protein
MTDHKCYQEPTLRSLTVTAETTKVALDSFVDKANERQRYSDQEIGEAKTAAQAAANGVVHVDRKLDKLSSRVGWIVGIITAAGLAGGGLVEGVTARAVGPDEADAHEAHEEGDDADDDEAEETPLPRG